ncbi:MAG: cyclase family protein [Acidimicrobiia bacterium]|nr:cyclase family protein [Acidimicrobiia bacterium]
MALSAGGGPAPPRRLLDLSQPWSGDTPAFPTDENPVVRWVKRLASHGTNHQKIETTLHVGTHLDAPLHWRDGGMDIASIPLERLYGPAVVVDLSDAVSDYSIITPDLVESRADIRDGDIVLLHTGYHRYYFCADEPDAVRYFFKHPGGYRDLAEWVVARRLPWLGVDMASPDHAMNSNLSRMWPHLATEAEAVLGQPLEDAFPVRDFQVMHTHLFRYDVPIVENLGPGLEQLLGARVEVCAFPWQFAGGEAAMVRVVAFLDR